MTNNRNNSNNNWHVMPGVGFSAKMPVFIQVFICMSP